MWAGVSRDRCTGHCCRDITTQCSPQELKASYKAWLNRKRYGFAVVNGTRKKVGIFTDIHLLYPMLRYRRKGKKKGRFVYDCIHLKKNGDCGIYEARPDMCARYPYGTDCQKKGCKWKNAATATARKKEKPKYLYPRKSKLRVVKD